MLHEGWFGLGGSHGRRGRPNDLVPLVERTGYGLEAGFRLSMAEMLLAAAGLDMSAKRLRFGDYVMLAAGGGVMQTDQLMFGKPERNWFTLRGGYGVQGSLLLTHALEVGAVVGTMGVTDWARSGEGEGNARPMRFKTARVRYRRTGAEIEHAASDPFGTTGGPQFTDTYLRAAVRYHLKRAYLGVDVDRHLTRPESGTNGGSQGSGNTGRAARVIFGIGA